MTLVDDFSAVLKRKIGLDSGSIGKAAVERAVRHRMNAAGVEDEHDYLMRVQTSSAEMQQLIEAVVVPETWFFRYPESQAAMAALARERLFAAGVPQDRVLRVLSVPSSTGEEPYSIAMALLDAGVPAPRFHVDAVDISERVIDFARHAVFGRNSFRGDDLAFRERHFTESADGYQLSALVKERVRFRQGNLFDSYLLLGVAPYDFVFCRNLLIYFDAPTQERAVQVLRRHTREDGVIFVGPAETSLLTARRLPAVPAARSFAFFAQALPAPAELPAVSKPIVHAWTPPRRPVAQTPVARLPVPHAAIAPATPIQAMAPAPAASSLPASAQASQASLRQIETLADQGRVQEALNQCRAYIDIHGASAEALYLSGLLQDAAGDARQAQAAYRKALYLEPGHREALLHLAALVASEGDHEGASRLQARAARQEARRE
ncbi:protein-glutamate O-methyltransferase CheR [Achromobacter seleniivolatilans]|uniref:Protein-glutamate O-methyltransferase CheR n=1 Tax=Achromobacter seleniivolatilans TaxID=3047478 RepID=A0ABY9M3T0_9BURK|nr:protein-glutamate O-methyltransferase CheR [Achromobacter sp. R39]WMD21661.1 protein-glutamate O-methyltransferase CheR [Achromobacter sp. R39]